MFLATLLLVENFWEKQHPVFGVSMGTLLLIWLVTQSLNRGGDKPRRGRRR